MRFSSLKLLLPITFFITIFSFAIAQNLSDSPENLKNLADYGSPEAQLIYGQMLYDQRNYKEAEIYFKKAADNKEKNNTEAAYMLGWMYYNEMLGKPNYKKAKEYFEIVANSDDIRKAKANYFLGQIYFLEGDTDNFLLYFSKSASGNYLPAQQWLIDYYEQSPDPDDSLNHIYWSSRAAENGDEDRILKFANDYLAQNNIKEAIYWLKKSADAGNISSAYKVGMLEYNGEGGTPNYSDALKYLKQAADGGIVEADNYVGICYLYGLGFKETDIKKRATEAAEYFAKNNGGLISNFYLAVCSRLGGYKAQRIDLSYSAIQKKYKESYGEIVDFRDFNKAATLKFADESDPLTSYVLGVIYSYGIANPVNPNKAFYLFKEAADKDIAPALVDLGYCYEVGEGTKPNMTEAIRSYRKAAQLGDPVGQYNLALSYINGDGVAKNPEEAVKYYQMAADQGYAAAQCNLGLCYETGTGVGQPDPKKAVEWYKEAAYQGLDIAQCNLAYCYENGIGTDKNLKNAIKYYKLAADQGDEVALNYLIDIFTKTSGIDVTANAVKYLKLADEKGKSTPNTLYLLGVCYENGYDIDRNMKEAVYYYKQALEKGNADALNALVNCYIKDASVDTQEEIARYFEIALHQGNGIAQYRIGVWYDMANDYANALRYFRKAAESGSEQAQYKLGLLYEEGNGTTQNIEEAKKWYNKAAAQGNVEAKKALDSLNRKTPKNYNSPDVTNGDKPSALINNSVEGKSNVLIEQATKAGSQLLEENDR